MTGISQNPPLFSVVTVVYNDREGLAKTWESFRRQTESKVEWIVIDGGSTDGTKELIEEIKADIDFYISERDRGIYDAMNKGIVHSTGDYVVFMNAGDVFYNESTLKNVASFLSNQTSKTEMVLGGAKLAFPNRSEFDKKPRDLRQSVWHGLPANHQAIYFSRDRLNECQYNLDFRICGDYALVATLFMRGIRYKCLDEPLVQFRVGDTSFKRPMALIGEAFKVQSSILNTPFPLRLLSILIHLLSHARLRVIAMRT
jgi:putative colanic acid biosynthesis glycosyltransferase